MDVEDIHQIIYKNVHNRLQEYLVDERLANAVWLGTEDAAKEIYAMPYKSFLYAKAY